MSFVGKNIKKIRKVNKLNQSQFAELFELSRSKIGSYEEERAEPKTDSLIKIAKYFSIPIEILITKEITVNDLTHFENSIHESHLPEKTAIPHGNHIPYVPINEHGSYLVNHGDQNYLNTLNHLSLPLPENIRTRAFQLDSSHIFVPKHNYRNDNIFIGTYVNKKFFTTIPRNQPYIIVTENTVVCTHLLIQNNQVLIKNTFETSSIKLDEITEMWTLIGRYESTITPNNSLVDKVAKLEQRMDELENKYNL
jgi:transcriptional regulator with XRE-family HTH domain